MFSSHSFGLLRFASILTVAAGLLVSAGCATTTVQSTGAAPQPYRTPLAGKEIVERLKGGANQTELIAEVNQRGVNNFSATDFDALKAAGASPELQNAVVASLQKGTPAPPQTTYVYRDNYWPYYAAPWFWGPRFGLHWHHYRRR
jgi:hypothetical protein